LAWLAIFTIFANFREKWSLKNNVVISFPA
jgi:hypothetical protein